VVVAVELVAVQVLQVPPGFIPDLHILMHLNKDITAALVDIWVAVVVEPVLLE
jgi:hypothetical protein